jgi:hypothetical protein
MARGWWIELRIIAYGEQLPLLPDNILFRTKILLMSLIQQIWLRLEGWHEAPHTVAVPHFTKCAFQNPQISRRTVRFIPLHSTIYYTDPPCKSNCDSISKVFSSKQNQGQLLIHVKTLWVYMICKVLFETCHSKPVVPWQEINLMSYLTNIGIINRTRYSRYTFKIDNMFKFKQKISFWYYVFWAHAPWEPWIITTYYSISDSFLNCLI